jgi:hypothetical protein
VTPDELAAIMARGAEEAGRRMIRLLLGEYDPEELAGLWLVVVEDVPLPMTDAIVGTTRWERARAEVQTALDEAAGVT